MISTYKLNCTALEIILTIIITVSSENSEFQEMNFYADILCLNMTVSGGCLEKVPLLMPGSRIECASVCLQDLECIGASVDSEDSCFIHYDDSCFDDKQCNEEESWKSQHHYMSKGCDKRGIWHPSNNSCKCQKGWYGPSCQNLPKTCLDLKRSGYAGGQHKTVLDPYQNGIDLITTFCYIDDDNDDYFMEIMYNPEKAKFNRSWIGYRDGFINETTELFWIGFKHWKTLSDFGYRKLYLTIDVGNFGYKYRTYSGFRLEGESENFRFSFESTREGERNLSAPLNNISLHVGDCLGPYNNTPFSTYDRDNEAQSGQNCASLLGSAWWFQTCESVCNIFGWGSEYWEERPPQQHARIRGFNMSIVQEYFLPISFLLTS